VQALETGCNILRGFNEHDRSSEDSRSCRMAIVAVLHHILRSCSKEVCDYLF
ncbi:unnamed protein product, partial [Amoebophrya sp. A25]